MILLTHHEIEIIAKACCQVSLFMIFFNFTKVNLRGYIFKYKNIFLWQELLKMTNAYKKLKKVQEKSET